MAFSSFPLPAGGVPGGSTADRPSNPTIGDTFYNGELVQLEIYTDDGWVALGVAPGVVSSVTATDVGTNRAFNNGAVSLAFTPPSGMAGGAVTFSAISSPGSYTGTGTDSPVTVTGLGSNTSYTFNVTGTNAYGTGSPVTSPSTTVTTVPETLPAPVATNITEVNYGSAPSASVAFTAQNSGGKAISGYTITSTPGGLTTTGATSPLVVTGLTAGTSYTYTVVATNANGTSAISNASSSLIASTKPDAPTIGTATRISGNEITLGFTAPNDGGSAITSYVVSSTPAVTTGLTVTAGTSSPVTVNGTFISGQAYTFTIAAVNANGTGGYSGASNSIVPAQSQPFSMSLPTTNALYVADVSLNAGTYTVGISPATTAYLSILDTTGTTIYNSSVTNGQSITLSSGAVKAACFAQTSNCTVSVGTSPVAVTTTAAGTGSLTTITSGTSYTPNSTGFGYVVALGGGQGGSSQDVPGNNGYGGHGGRAAVPIGSYIKLTSGVPISYTVGARGNGGTGGGGEGNAGGNTTWGSNLTAAGATVSGPGVPGGGTGGNSWNPSNGQVQPNPYSGIKSGTNGSGGGGSGNFGLGSNYFGAGSGIGTGGNGAGSGGAGGAASGFAAGGGGAGHNFGQPGGNGSQGVIYLVEGLN